MENDRNIQKNILPDRTGFARKNDDAFSIDSMGAYPGKLPYHTDVSAKYGKDAGNTSEESVRKTVMPQINIPESSTGNGENQNPKISSQYQNRAKSEGVVADNNNSGNSENSDINSRQHADTGDTGNYSAGNGNGNTDEYKKSKSSHRNFLALILIALILVGCVVFGYISNVFRNGSDNKKDATEVIRQAKENTENYDYGISTPQENNVSPAEEPEQSTSDLQISANNSGENKVQKSNTIDAKPKYVKQSAQLPARKTVKQKSAITPKPKIQEATGDAIYAIQIFSSPNKVEADKILNDAGRGAYISTQVINGKIWYRVRFGHFSTKEEAVATAKEKRFNNYWIDRVL